LTRETHLKTKENLMALNCVEKIPQYTTKQKIHTPRKSKNKIKNNSKYPLPNKNYQHHFTK
jgi:hypothetical protein